MANTEMTISINEHLAAMVRKAAAGSPESESEVIERALHAYFNLSKAANDLRDDFAGLASSEEEANSIAYAELKAYRAEKSER